MRRRGRRKGIGKAGSALIWLLLITVLTIFTANGGYTGFLDIWFSTINQVYYAITFLAVIGCVVILA